MCGTWGEGGLKTIPVGCHWGREWCTARPAQPKRTKWNHQVLKCHLTRCMVPKRHKLLLGGITHWLIFVFSATNRLFLFWNFRPRIEVVIKKQETMFLENDLDAQVEKLKQKTND